MRKKLLIFNIVVLCLIVFISPLMDVDINLDHILEAPSKNFIFGTDHLGRNVFALLVVGGFRTIEVVLIATIFSFSVGVFLGLTTGYLENFVSTIIKSLVDLLLVVPTLIFALIVSYIFGITPLSAGLSLGLFGIGNFMNHAEALTKREKEKEYILASKILGVPDVVILYKNIFINILPELLVNLANTSSGVILQYSALTFIGLGADLTKPDWGSMLYQYRIYLIKYPLLIILPTLCILWITLSFNLLFDKNRSNHE